MINICTLELMEKKKRHWNSLKYLLINHLENRLVVLH